MPYLYLGGKYQVQIQVQELATKTDVFHIRKFSRANARSVPGEFTKSSQQKSQNLSFLLYT
jgi:hypothetical protein